MPGQSAFFVVRGEDLPRATFAKTIESIVEPLFSPAHFPAQGTSSAVWMPGCIPRPFRRRNPAESNLWISSRQGFWRKNLFHCALAAVGGASDHKFSKFSKYDGIEAVVFLALLCISFVL